MVSDLDPGKDQDIEEGAVRRRGDTDENKWLTGSTGRESTNEDHLDKLRQ